MIKRLQSHNVTTLTNTEEMSSTRCLQELNKWSEHVQRPHAPPDRTASAGWADSNHMPRNTCQPSTTASLSQAIPIVSSMPFCSLRLLHQCCDQHRAWNRVERFDLLPIIFFFLKKNKRDEKQKVKQKTKKKSEKRTKGGKKVTKSEK